jgi:hypothetical protein
VKKETFFSRAMLRELRMQFAMIDTVNPANAQFNAFRRHVNGLPEPQRAQLAANNIRFLSHIARGSFV